MKGVKLKVKLFIYPVKVFRFKLNIISLFGGVLFGTLKSVAICLPVGVYSRKHNFVFP